MGNYLQVVLRVSVILAVGIFVLSIDTKVNAQTTDPRVAIGIPTADLTIFRTVWNLSCHPQNPLLHEVPHYVMYAPEWTPANGVVSNDGTVYKSKGTCWAYHNEGNTNHVPNKVGMPANPGSEDASKPYPKNLRPSSPIHHYMVIEFPNPVYDPAYAEACKNGTIREARGTSYKPKHDFCAPYLHWEGYARLKQLAISVQEKEVWYVENFLGGWTLDGKNVIDGFPTNGTLFNTPVGRVNNKDVYSAVLIIDPKDAIVLKICSGWNYAAWPRLGDGEKNDLPNTRPCWVGNGGDGRVFSSLDVPNPDGSNTPPEIHPNPLLFTDIAHSRFGRNPRNDASIGDGDGGANVKHVREWFDDDLESRELHIPDPRYPDEDDKGDYAVDQTDDDWVKCSGQNGGEDIYDTLFDKEYKGKIYGGMYNAATNTTRIDYTGYRDYIKKFKFYLKSIARPSDPDGNTNSDPLINGARISIALSPVMPFECDYRPLAQDPGVEIHPTTRMVNVGPNPIGKPQRLAALANNWVSTGVVLPPIPTPTRTPTPTTSQTSPTPTYLRSDFTGGTGGAKDGRVTIQDLTQLYSEFYRTDLPTLKANIATQCPGTTQCQTATIVDIQDYNIFTTDWRAYLETL